MSEENVEAVRRSIDAFNRGDRATWLALRDEDCEIVPIGDWPGERAIRGREAGWAFYLDAAVDLGQEAVDVDVPVTRRHLDLLQLLAARLRLLASELLAFEHLPAPA